ncbi:MAG: hypothetical protein KDI36_11060, partial [Pseudomonadales bacterium]|nr:hypothetical protein [Pseudomonadales bacterium]
MVDITGLDDLEQDLLQELFNISLSKAAEVLSLLVNQEVELTTPVVEFAQPSQVREMMSDHQYLCAVEQEIRGGFLGRAQLVFANDTSIEIVRLMLADKFSTESVEAIHQDAFCEVGNIVINACIASLSEPLGEDFEIGLPTCETGPPERLFAQSANHGDPLLLTRINIQLRKSDIAGFIIFSLSPDSFTTLKG